MKSKKDSTEQRFTVTLELETFQAKTPLDAVLEALKTMDDNCGLVYNVTDNITGEKFVVDMAEDEGNEVTPKN